MANKLTMRAAIVESPQNVRIAEIPLPRVPENSVCVRLEGCGVCGSNFLAWEGRPWFRYPFAPGAPGHEGWGRVHAVGERVKNVRVGERVALLSYNAFAEYDITDAANVVPIPPALDDEPIPGEALGCAMNVFRRADIQRGQLVAIVGIGFLGALLTNLCVRAGAEVIAISRRPFALEIARRMGAQHVIGMRGNPEIIEHVKALTKGPGCDRVIEAVGRQEPLDLAGELTRERGKLIIAGYHQDGERRVNMQLWNWRGIDVINAHERDPQIYLRGMREAIAAIADGRLNASPLYTHRFKLDQLSGAMNTMRERPEKFLKATVTYGRS